MATALALVACAAPPSVDHVGPVNEISLGSRVVFDESARHRLFRVLGIDGGEKTGELSLITSDGVVWMNASGAVIRRVEFSSAGTLLAPARRLHDAGVVYYAGFDFPRNRILFFDAEGREFLHQPCGLCREFVVADLDGNGRESLVVGATDGAWAKVFRDRGSVIETLAATGYLTDVVAARLPGEPTDSLFFYSSPDRELQKAVRITRPNGGERAHWPIRAQSAIVATTAADGAPSILSIDEDAVVEYDALTGRTLSRTRLERASAFREMDAAWWRNGMRVFVLSGGGYLNGHMVVVVDAAGRVVFREIGDERSWASYVPSRDASTFYVGVEGHVKQYSLK